MISLQTDSDLVERETSMPQGVELFEVNELALMTNLRTCQQASHNSLDRRIGRFSPQNRKILLKTVLFHMDCGSSFGPGKMWESYAKSDGT